MFDRFYNVFYLRMVLWKKKDPWCNILNASSDNDIDDNAKPIGSDALRRPPSFHTLPAGQSATGSRLLPHTVSAISRCSE